MRVIFLAKNFLDLNKIFINIEGFDTQAIDTPIGSVFHSRDIQILETLFWPLWINMVIQK